MLISNNIYDHHEQFVGGVFLLSLMIISIIAYYSRYQILLYGSICLIVFALIDLLWHAVSPHQDHTQHLILDALIHFGLVLGLIIVAFGMYKALFIKEKEDYYVKAFKEHNALIYFEYDKTLDQADIEFSEAFVKRYNLDYKVLKITYETFLSYISPKDLPRLLNEDKSFNFSYKQIEFKIKYPGMNDYHLMLSKNIKNDETYFITFDIDISEYKRLKKRLDMTQSKLNYIMHETNYFYEETSDFIAKFDKKGTVLFATKSYERIFERPLDEIIGKTLTELNQYQNRTKEESWINEVFRKRYLEETVEIPTNSGHIYVAWKNQVVTDALTKESVVVSIGHDITDLMELSYQLEYKSKHDSLTDLLNRDGLEDKVTSLTHLQRYVLFMIDLEMFSSINEYYSHDIGDQVIKQVADALRDFNQYDCLPVRMSGDEFLLICPYVSELQFNKVLDSLKALTYKTYRVNPLAIEVRKNIGYTFFTKGKDDFNEALKAADLAMVEVSYNKTERIAQFNAIMKENLETNIELAQAIRNAIEKDLMDIYVQVITDVLTGKPVGYEILSRYNDQVRGVIPPERIFQVAQEASLSRQLDFYLVDKALKILRPLQIAGILKGYIAINILPETLISKDLIKNVEHLIEKHQVDPSKIVVEISEKTFINNVDDCIRQIKTLKTKGFLIAFDDFGREYSSLASLNYIDFDSIKIDQVFIKNLQNDYNKEVINMVRRIADIEGKQIVAEGVETETQANELVKMGVTVHQGFYYSKPLPIDEMFKKRG